MIKINVPVGKLDIISDPHFGHDQPFIFKERGFQSIEEHDKMIMSKIYEVAKGRTILCLGDFTLLGLKRARQLITTCQKAPADFLTLYGNHDTKVLYRMKRDGLIRTVGDMCFVEDGRQSTVFSHYPQLCWYKQHYGAAHLFGHVHSTKLDDVIRSLQLRALNVTVDNLLRVFGQPIVPLEEILNYIDTKH